MQNGTWDGFGRSAISDWEGRIAGPPPELVCWVLSGPRPLTATSRNVSEVPLLGFQASCPGVRLTQRLQITWYSIQMLSQGGKVSAGGKLICQGEVYLPEI